MAAPTKTLSALGTVAILVTGVVTAGSAQAATFTTTSLGSVVTADSISANGLGYAQGIGINDAGQVLLHTGSASAPKAAIWQAGKVTTMANMFGGATEGVAINASGTVVGVAFPLAGPGAPAQWTSTGTKTNLNTPLYIAGRAMAVNDAGQTAFYQNRIDGTIQPAVRQGSTTTPLSLPSGLNPKTSLPLEINRSGQVFVTAQSSNNTTYFGFLVAPGGSPTSVNTAAFQADVMVGPGHVLSDSGQLLGETPNSLFKNEVRSATGAIIPLKPLSTYTLPDGTGVVTSVDGRDINATGDVVGSSMSCFCGGAQDYHATLWRAGVPTDVHPAWAWRSRAELISDRGTVLGVYYRTDGTTGGFAYRNGVWVDLGAIGSPVALNERDQAVFLVGTSATTATARLVTLAGL